MQKRHDSKNPLISIVVPVYNGERYLRECVDSIRNQDYENIEIIIVNDGSSDNSIKVANELADIDKRVKVINQENSGVSAARNNGIDNASGEYISFIDVDDFICKDYISYFYNLILENNAEIALTPQPRKFNENTKNDVQEKIEDRIEVWSGQKTAAQMLYYNVVIAPWNKMISCDLIRKNNLRFNTKLAFGEGFNFSVDCFQRANRVAVGHRKVYNYRVDNPNSVMTKFSMRLVTGSIEAQKCIKENLVEKTPELLKACRYANWHTYCDCFNTMVGCNVAKKHKDIFKQVKKVCRKEAFCVIGASVPKKEKIKGLVYFISPYLAAKLINNFRVRKFTVEQ